MAGKRIRLGQRAAAAAMIQAGATVREAAMATGMSKSSAAVLAHGDDAPPELVDAVKERLQGRLLVASDRYLSQSLDRLKDLSPYQAMLCSGIAHDHYLRSRQSDRGSNTGGLTQILIQIDQSTRCSVSIPTIPAGKLSD